MTPGEAWELLGVSDGATRKEIRRAYLRQVKQHKPDRDPEGFQRVREAYEVVRHFGYDPALHGDVLPTPVLAGPVDRPDQSVPEPSETSTEASSEGVAVGAAASEAVAGEEPDQEPEEELGADPNFGEYLTPPWELEEASREALDRDIEGLDLPDALARVRQEIDAHPERADPWWYLFDLLSEADGEEADREEANAAMLQMLNEAVDAGFPVFISQIAQVAPASVTDEQLETLRGLPYEGASVRRVLFERRAYDEILDRALEVVSTDPPTLLLDVAVDLYRHDQGEKAARLYRALEREIEVHARGAELSEYDKVRLLFVGELALLGEQLPAAVRHAVLDGLHEGDPLIYAFDIAAWARGSRLAARRARKALKRYAPTLHSLYDDSLSPSGTSTTDPLQPRMSKPTPIWWYWVAAFAVLRFFWYLVR